MSVLHGYKTYILAIIIVISSVSEAFLGVDVPGYDLDVGEAIMVALGLFTARLGAKVDVNKGT